MGTDVYIYKLHTTRNELEPILRDYIEFKVDNFGVNSELQKLKNAVKLDDAFRTCLRDYCIIGVGKHEEGKHNHQYTKNWRAAVEEIVKDIETEESILRINLNVEIKESDIFPTEETITILKEYGTSESEVCLSPHERVRTPQACFAIYEHIKNVSTIDINVSDDVHSIMNKRKRKVVLEVLHRYYALVESVSTAIDNFQRNFPETVDAFTPTQLESIASKFDLKDAGSCRETDNVQSMPILNRYRDELISLSLDEMTKELISKFQRELRTRISTTLSHSFKGISFEMEKMEENVYNMSDFVIKVLDYKLTDIFESVKQTIFPVVENRFPVDVNSSEWRLTVATEIYSEIQTHHRDIIIDNVQHTLRSVADGFQKELKMLEKVKFRLNSIQIPRESDYFTCLHCSYDKCHLCIGYQSLPDFDEKWHVGVFAYCKLNAV